MPATKVAGINRSLQAGRRPTRWSQLLGLQRWLLPWLPQLEDEAAGTGTIIEPDFFIIEMSLFILHLLSNQIRRDCHLFATAWHIDGSYKTQLRRQPPRQSRFHLHVSQDTEGNLSNCLNSSTIWWPFR
jgi:hypothetical protein